MKTLMFTIGLILLLVMACEKEDNLSENYFNKLQGKWENVSDSSLLEFYDVVMYIKTDTIVASCSYYLNGNLIVVKNGPVEYRFNIVYITDSILILNDKPKLIYKKL
jgi:hypothetical protein